MKNLFKQKPKTPLELVRQTRELLLFFDRNTETRESKREEKRADLIKLISEMRTVLYGNGGNEPHPQLTQEFFKEDTLRLLIICIPMLSLGARQDATHVVANLQRQRVQSRLIACEYLEQNLHIMDILIPGYQDESIALTYGTVARECIRHQSVARYVMESDHMKKFFEYIQIPNFEIASDAAATFRELLTRHKSTVAEFLTKNYEWFFPEYNSQLLESSNYITRRHAIKLLGDVLLHPSNVAVMIKYVSSLQNMRIMMNLLRDSNKSIELEASHVFKLFVVNQNKPPEVVTILVTNRSKLIRFFNDFNIDKEDAQFEADKAQLVKEIAELQPRDLSSVELEVDKAQLIKEAAEVQLNDSSYIEPVPEKAHEVWNA